MSLKKESLYLLLCFIAISVASSCSTTGTIPDGSYRLKENKISISDSKDFKATSLEPYLKQEANSYYIFGWNPFLYVYNWSSGNETGWDKFVEKLGVEPVVFDSSSVASSKSGMLSHLNYLGYYDSHITDTIIKNRKLATVKYDVSIGKQYYISKIDYQIEDTALLSIFRNDSSSHALRTGVPLSEEVLENESERLAQLFRNNGYYGFTKNYFFFTADTTSVRDSALLVVRLENYTRNENPSSAKKHTCFNIGSVSITPQGGLKVRQSFLDNLNRIEPGSLYNEKEINNTYQRFATNRVFSTVNIQLDQSDSSLVDCNILLSPSKLQGFKLNLEGSVNSTGLFGISPSLSYSHKNIFGGGEILSLGFRGNFQFMLDDPVHSNEFAISSSLTLPQFLLLPERIFESTVPRTEISFSFNYQNRPEYTRNIISLSYGYIWNVSKKLYFQVSPVKMNIVNISNLSQQFYDNLDNPYLINSYQKHFDFGASATVYYTTNSDVTPEESYFYLRWQTDVAGNLLSLFNSAMDKNKLGSHLIWGIPYSQYVESEISLVQTIRFGGDNQFSLAGRFLAGAGYAYGNSTALPFEKLLYAGGANSMRGWQTRMVGPGNAPIDTTFSIANQTGDLHLEANIEFRFPLFWKLNGALFADAGNVWNLQRSELSTDSSSKGEFSFDNLGKSIALDWGAGLRLDFGMILVRLDLGIKAYDPAEIRWRSPNRWFKSGGYAVHFGIGYPF